MGVRGRGARAGQAAAPPRMKYFRLLSWSPYHKVGDYIAHIHQELGRLGFAVEDIESRSSPPNGEEVLSELLGWIGEHPGANYAALVEWQNLDFANLTERLDRNRDAKPRIEVTAEITKMRNFSVRWYPAGWRDASPNWGETDRHPWNMIGHKIWDTPPDFRWFRGDQPATFDGRATNELMFIRGVGNLHPEPRDEYGTYAKFNHDLVDSMLIAAVRAAYEGLIEQLSNSFEVEVLDAFEFSFREEDSDDEYARRPDRRVVGWQIVDARELRARQAREAEEAREVEARAEISNIAARHNCTFAELLRSLDDASRSRPPKGAADLEQIYRVAAKSLRSAGADITVREVRRLIQHLRDFMPDELPELLKADAAPPA